MIIRDTNGNARGFGFLTYFTGDATLAVLRKPNHRIHDNEVFVEPAFHNSVPRSMRHTKTVYIFGIPESVSDAEILRAFSSYGGINHYRRIKDHNTGRRKSFSFLQYHSEAVATFVASRGWIEVGGKAGVRVLVEDARPRQLL